MVRTIWTAAAIFIVSGAAIARAASIKEITTFNFAAPIEDNYPHIQLATFDPSLGMLEAASLTINVGIVPGAGIYATGPVGPSTVTLVPDLTFILDGTSSPDLNATPASGPFSLQSEVVHVPAGTSYSTVSGQVELASRTVSLDLQYLTGDTPFNSAADYFSIYFNGGTSVAQGLGYNIQYGSTSLSGGAVVTYDYAPVPEPSSALLLTLPLVALYSNRKGRPQT